jgi:hypothetical protein
VDGVVDAQQRDARARNGVTRLDIRVAVDAPGLEPVVDTVHAFDEPPAAVDVSVDYSPEPTTLVAFDLSEVDSGTLLRVIESGFDRIPAARRDEAFRMNSGGWEEQMVNIEKYVAKG